MFRHRRLQMLLRDLGRGQDRHAQVRLRPDGDVLHAIAAALAVTQGRDARHQCRE